MLSRKLLCSLLMVQICSSAITSAGNIIVFTGETAILPCEIPFNNSMKIRVKWEKVGMPNICQFSIENNKTQDHKCNPRFEVNTKPVGLAITSVENSDAGVYNCVMTRVIPPPTVSIITLLMLNVPSLTLQLINTTNDCVELHCSIKGLKTQQANFTWTGAGLHANHTSSNMSSILTFCKPNWTKGDTITCRSSYLNKFIVTNISLPCNSGDCKDGKTEMPWLIIAVISTSAGLLLLILLSVIIYKCKKRPAENGTIIYRNKIYENFTFSTATINPVLTPENAQLGARSNFRSTTRSYPQTIRQTQKEECIYEN